MEMKALSFILLLTTAIAAGARDTMDGIFNERIRTVTVTAGNDFYAPPMTVLGSDDVLTIAFDHLSEEVEYMRYRVVRCDANWQPSSIAEAQWLDSFNESNITDYAFSGATTVHYVHYWFNFPNEDISPTMSGNYLIEVYPENDPDDVWFARRVMLSEQVAPISVSVTTQTDIDYNSAHQQLAITVDSERASVADPFNDITVMVAQNGRYDNEVALRQPLRMSGSRSIYEHQQPLIFEAGNEYRRMEVADINYPGMGVEEIAYAYPYYHFKLYNDLPRADASYSYDQTQHGRFYIRQYGSDDSDLNADYVVVHFALQMPQLEGCRIFIDGNLTSRRFDAESIMAYNQLTGCYEKVLLLKQGAYNYQYIAVPNGANSGTTSIIEGNKYQTQNEYLIKVYTRGPLDRSDRLIGVTLITSQP